MSGPFRSFEEAYGEANKDFGALNRTNTKFNLGSMNKMFTAVAVTYFEPIQEGSTPTRPD